MAYQSYPKAQAVVLEKAFKDAADKLKANKNPLKSGDLKKAVENAGKALQVKLETDIAGVRKNAIEHFTKIDTYLGEANKGLKLAKDAYERYKDSGQQKDADTAGYGAPYLASILKVAKDDADAFGKSWFEYRGYNPGVDAKYSGKYNDEVGKIMAESKGVLVKVQKIEGLQKEAAALANLVKSTVVDGGIIGKQDAAEQLLKGLEEQHTKMFLGSKDINSAMTNVENIGKYAKDPKTPKTMVLKNIEQVFVNLMNLVKGYIQSVGTMQKVYDTEMKQFTSDDLKDAEIKVHIGKAQKLLTEVKYKVQVLESAFKNTTKDMETIRKMFAGKK